MPKSLFLTVSTVFDPADQSGSRELAPALRALEVAKALHLEIVATMKEMSRTSHMYKEHFEQVVKSRARRENAEPEPRVRIERSVRE